MQVTNGRSHPHRILVVANETSDGAELLDAVTARAGAGRADVLVVAPALNSRLRHWTSDDESAQRAAEARLRRCLQRLRLAGVDAEGVVGDVDPLLAIEDCLYRFPADEIVIATQAAARSRWLRRDVVARARGRFPVEVHHVVVATEGGEGGRREAESPRGDRLRRAWAPPPSAFPTGTRWPPSARTAKPLGPASRST